MFQKLTPPPPFLVILQLVLAQNDKCSPEKPNYHHHHLISCSQVILKTPLGAFLLAQASQSICSIQLNNFATIEWVSLTRKVTGGVDVWLQFMST